MIEQNTKTLPLGVTHSHLDEMTHGWFVGGFQPAAYSTNDVEVAVKRLSAGYRSEAHYHKLATEVTLLLQGRAVMANIVLLPGDILTLSPGVTSTFEALEDCITVVVKHPGAPNDKYSEQMGE